MKTRRRWAILATAVVGMSVTGCGGPSAAASAAVSPTATRGAGSWLPAGQLALARASTYAVPLADGRVLVVGNDNICMPDDGAWQDSARAELYDPAANSWTSTGSLNAPRSDFAAVALPNGSVLVTGGLTAGNPAEGVYGAYSSTKLYDPGTGTWSATSTMNTARTEPVAALLDDGTALVAGGAYVDRAGYRVLSSAEIYDPDTALWSPTGGMLAARRDARAVTLSDGRVLVVGGSSTGRRLSDAYTIVQSAEIFDPATSVWSQAGSLATARRDFNLVALPDGGALVVGGTRVDAAGGATQVVATAERFDPTARTWSATGPMTLGASNRSAVLLADGRILVAGGVASLRVGSAPAIVSAELYDPTSDTWSPTASLPEAREGAVFVALRDGTALLVGGDTGYVGPAMMPWCPPALATALRYVP